MTYRTTVVIERAEIREGVREASGYQRSIVSGKHAWLVVRDDLGRFALAFNAEPPAVPPTPNLQRICGPWGRNFVPDLLRLLGASRLEDIIGLPVILLFQDNVNRTGCKHTHGLSDICSIIHPVSSDTMTWRCRRFMALCARCGQPADRRGGRHLEDGLPCRLGVPLCRECALVARPRADGERS